MDSLHGSFPPLLNKVILHIMDFATEALLFFSYFNDLKGSKAMKDLISDE